MDEQNNLPEEIEFTDIPEGVDPGWKRGDKYGNLLSVIPGVIICALTVAFAFILIVCTDLLLEQEQRDKIQEAMHMDKIVTAIVEMQDSIQLGE